MASQNQLRARVPDAHVELIREVSIDRDITETEAERVVVREGLTALGYVERPIEPGDVLLRYARKSGSVLGFVGLILVGYGLFGAASFRFLGFGLLLAGFGLISGAEFAPVVKSRLVPDGVEEAAA